MGRLRGLGGRLRGEVGRPRGICRSVLFLLVDSILFIVRGMVPCSVLSGAVSLHFVHMVFSGGGFTGSHKRLDWLAWNHGKLISGTYAIQGSVCIWAVLAFRHGLGAFAMIPERENNLVVIVRGFRVLSFFWVHW